MFIAVLPALLLTGDAMTIPFEWLKPGYGLVAIETVINGQASCRLAVDTGNANPLAISEALAKKLNLPLIEPKETHKTLAVGSGNQVKLWDTSPLEFGLGTETFHHVTANVSNYVDHLATALQIQLDGNLGHGFLKDFTVTFDYPAKTLTLSHEALSSGVPFHLAKRPLIVVETKVNGQGPYHFVVDTGAMKCVLSPELAAHLKVNILGKAKMLGGAGAAEAQMADGVSMQVGDKTTGDLTVVVADFTTLMSKTLGEPIDGVVGFDFFGKGKLTIDYSHTLVRFD